MFVKKENQTMKYIYAALLTIAVSVSACTPATPIMPTPTPRECQVERVRETADFYNKVKEGLLENINSLENFQNTNLGAAKYVNNAIQEVNNYDSPECLSEWKKATVDFMDLESKAFVDKNNGDKQKSLFELQLSAGIIKLANEEMARVLACAPNCKPRSTPTP